MSISSAPERTQIVIKKNTIYISYKIQEKATKKETKHKRQRDRDNHGKNRRM
jgi:hypothetical protein